MNGIQVPAARRITTISNDRRILKTADMRSMESILEYETTNCKNNLESSLSRHRQMKLPTEIDTASNSLKIISPIGIWRVEAISTKRGSQRLSIVGCSRYKESLKKPRTFPDTACVV